MVASLQKEAIYPVSVAVRLLGLTDGRVYQLMGLAEGKSDWELPQTGYYLKTATPEEKRERGVNPDVITKPEHWITASEIRRFRLLNRGLRRR